MKALKDLEKPKPTQHPPHQTIEQNTPPLKKPTKQPNPNNNQNKNPTKAI